MLIVIADIILLALGLGILITSNKQKPTSSAITTTSHAPQSSTSSPTTSSTPASHGLYVALLENQVSKYPDLLNNKNIDGFQEITKWSDLEPSQGQYNWSQIDNDIRAVAAHHQHFSLDIATGAFTPSWAYGNDTSNAISFTIVSHNGGGKDLCDNNTIPIPWAPVYQTSVKQMIDGLAQHINSDPTLSSAVTQVRLTGITEDTVETRMPTEFGITCKDRNSGQTVTVTDALGAWCKVGYTKSKAETAWETFANEWASQFKNQTLAMATIPADGFPSTDAAGTIASPNCVTQKAPRPDTQTTADLVKYAANKWGNRFMVMRQSLNNGNNSSGSGATSYASTSKAAISQGASIGFQLDDVMYGPNSSGANESSFNEAVSNGLKYHMTYLEVFRNDPALYPTTLVTAHSTLNPTKACSADQTGTPPNCVTQPTACTACSSATINSTDKNRTHLLELLGLLLMLIGGGGLITALFGAKSHKKTTSLHNKTLNGQNIDDDLEPSPPKTMNDDRTDKL